MNLNRPGNYQLVSNRIKSYKTHSMSNFFLFTFFLQIMVAPILVAGQQTTDSNRLIMAKNTFEKSGQKDFDFEIGTWKTRLKTLKNPISETTEWLLYEGTTIVKKVLNGKANLVELNVKGSSGNIEGVSLRLYNPDTRQWGLHFANVRNGILAIPAVGKFENGRGEFYNEDTFNGHEILVRFTISGITANACHFEQAFSMDNGKTWKVNWIADDTRVNRKR